MTTDRYGVIWQSIYLKFYPFHPYQNNEWKSSLQILSVEKGYINKQKKDITCIR